MATEQNLTQHLVRMICDDERINAAATTYALVQMKLDPTKNYSETFEQDEKLESEFYEHHQRFLNNLLGKTIAEFNVTK
jgi:hypothetical protein